MKINEYDEKIELAFAGQGGTYFKDNYEESAKGKISLLDIARDVVEDIKCEEDLGEELSEEEKKLTTRFLRDEVDALSLLNDYLSDRKMSYPELCGSICGVLFRNGRLKDALEFAEVHDMTESRYWDS